MTTSAPTDLKPAQPPHAAANSSSMNGSDRAPTLVGAVSHSRTRTTAVVVALMFIAVTVGMMVPKVRTTPWGSANTKSRFATIQCLVEKSTFSIDCSPYKATMDRVKLDDKLFSSKPPLLATASASVYFVMRPFGFSVEGKNNPVVYATNFVFALLPHVVLLLFFLQILLLITRHDHALILGMAAMSLGYIGTGYAIDLNNHTPAATCVVVGLFAVLKVWRAPNPKSVWFVVAGIASGLLPTIDLPSGAVSAAFLVALFVVDKKRTVLFFLPATLPPVLVHLALTYGATGSLIPIYLRPELYEYKTEPTTRDHPLVYLWNLSFGHHGIFSMTPVLLLGVVALKDSLLRKSGDRALAFLTVGTGVVLLAFYLTKTHNYGGVCVGFRWALTWVTLLMVFFAKYVDDRPMTRVRTVVVTAFLMVSMGNMMNALDNPWQDSKWQRTLVSWSKTLR